MSDMKSGRRECVTCGKLYKICRTCEEAKAQGRLFWRGTCDTTECYQVHMILKEFVDSLISKEDARAILENILTEEMLPYTENARGIIEKIFEQEEVVVPDLPEEGAPIIDADEYIQEESILVSEEPYNGTEIVPETVELEESELQEQSIEDDDNDQVLEPEIIEDQQEIEQDDEISEDDTEM